MSGYMTEKDFLVAEGDAGELYIFLHAKQNSPQSPVIIYDGRDHAVFLRNPDQKIILDYIHPDVREQLRHAHDVIVVETILENIKDSYLVKMKIVDNIPVDWSKIGLTTWEEAALNVKNDESSKNSCQI